MTVNLTIRRPAAIALVAAMMTGVTVGAQRRAPASEMQVKFQDADRSFADARYEDAYKQYNVVMSNGGDLAVPALKGMIRSALRLSSFQIAHQEAEALKATTTDADAFTLYGDALWADGLFDEADNAYRAAREQFPDAPRARYGMARSLMSRGRLDQALTEGLVASTALPNDPEVLVMLAQLYERLFRFDDAMQVYERYVKLLPSRIRSNSEAAALKVKLLKDFHGRTPVAMSDGDRPHIVPFTIRENKVVLDGLLNGKKIAFVLDTGADQTAVTNDAADRAGLRTVVETLITGVGTPSLRKLAIGRADTLTIGDLTVHDVPVSIRRDNMPGSQPWQNETFSPASLGLSLVVDYGRREVTLARTLPEEAAEVHLPLRLFRLPLVRGLVNEKFPAYFVVDTGGEMLSISNTKATELAMPPTRKIRLKVWGVNGIDQEAFVMPGVNLSFDAIQYRNFGVAVLNLRAPSVLLGFQLGGILGHSFLSGYRVGMDTARGELRLQKSLGIAAN